MRKVWDKMSHLTVKSGIEVIISQSNNHFSLRRNGFTFQQPVENHILTKTSSVHKNCAGGICLMLEVGDLAVRKQLVIMVLSKKSSR